MDYIVAGAPQSGTTWISLCLEEHPECYIPKHEEIHFFDWHYEKGKEWYYSLFDDAGDEQVKIDVCPHYMYVNDIRQKINNVLPEAKVVFILRDPIKRAYSHYCNSLRNGRVSRRIDEELHMDSKYIKKGEYSRPIRKISNQFETRVFIFEKMVESNEKFIKSIYRYIGVDQNVHTKWIDNKVNHRKKNVNSYLQDLSFAISSFLGGFEVGGKVIKKIRYSGMLEPIYEIIGSDYPKISDCKFQKLKQHFQGETDFINKNYNVNSRKYWLNSKPS